MSFSCLGPEIWSVGGGADPIKEWLLVPPFYYDYFCPGCKAGTSVITCYIQTGENEYAWRKRVGVVHKENCPHYINLVLLFPRLMKRIKEERSYGPEEAVA